MSIFHRHENEKSRVYIHYPSIPHKYPDHFVENRIHSEMTHKYEHKMMDNIFQIHFEGIQQFLHEFPYLVCLAYIDLDKDET
jgi:hypothetical protein